ncbi:phospholipase C [Thermosporothrix hazakensis]|jgi:phospholipase C|uniref:Phospholipase C n=1 Tax=Thermosporothrix hazakensis TaxID=644383 RepID=A0A326U9J3_THEHA|nr:zinc dependent phospholipase C family protein [Thermosporothrix hazakensis]PZW31207.1 phospholipase C [Thermosporothrix hazakensis]GCE50884.1 phospholipase C [Thermosporothrix hazakensis]
MHFSGTMQSTELLMKATKSAYHLLDTTVLPILKQEQEEQLNPFSERESTHWWMVSCAADLLRDEGEAGRRLYALVKPHQGRCGAAFHDALCLGLLDADKKAPFNDPLLPGGLMPTWKSHFYDPDTGTNWLGETAPTAVTNGELYYHLAHATWLNGDVERAGYYFGLSLHYMTDVTQPMHAANFTWLSSRDFGYHTDFEVYAREARLSIAPPTGYHPLMTGADVRSYIAAVARYIKDGYYAQVCRPEWTYTYKRDLMTTQLWDERVGSCLPALFSDAIQLTAGYMLLWMKHLIKLTHYEKAAFAMSY